MERQSLLEPRSALATRLVWPPEREPPLDQLPPWLPGRSTESWLLPAGPLVTDIGPWAPTATAVFQESIELQRPATAFQRISASRRLLHVPEHVQRVVAALLDALDAAVVDVATFGADAPLRSIAGAAPFAPDTNVFESEEQDAQEDWMDPLDAETETAFQTVGSYAPYDRDHVLLRDDSARLGFAALLVVDHTTNLALFGSDMEHDPADLETGGLAERMFHYARRRCNADWFRETAPLSDAHREARRVAGRSVSAATPVQSPQRLFETLTTALNRLYAHTTLGHWCTQLLYRHAPGMLPPESPMHPQDRAEICVAAPRSRWDPRLAPRSAFHRLAVWQLRCAAQTAARERPLVTLEAAGVLGTAPTTDDLAALDAVLARVPPAALAAAHEAHRTNQGHPRYRDSWTNLSAFLSQLPPGAREAVVLAVVRQRLRALPSFRADLTTVASNAELLQHTGVSLFEDEGRGPFGERARQFLINEMAPAVLPDSPFEEPQRRFVARMVLADNQRRAQRTRLALAPKP